MKKTQLDLAIEALEADRDVLTLAIEKLKALRKETSRKPSRKLAAVEATAK